jgi:predicted transcriptional regulator
MSKPAVLEITLDPEIHAALMNAAKTAKRPAAEIVGDLVRDYVAQEPAEPGHDQFLQQKVEIGRASMRAGQGRSNEEVESLFATLRQELLAQAR